jgi:hypothetical protein
MKRLSLEQMEDVNGGAGAIASIACSAVGTYVGHIWAVGIFGGPAGWAAILTATVIAGAVGYACTKGIDEGPYGGKW